MTTKNLQQLIKEMTLEEKADICNGHGFWTTKAFKHLGIPSLRMADGPHGIRKNRVNIDEIGFFGGIRLICFPSEAAWASSWNPALVEEIGKMLGEECQSENIDILLGPGINIKRHPLGGRNFEYISEDPYLTALLGAAWVKGLQWYGIGACLKHFVANNAEFERTTIDVKVDERALREIYLFAFEYIIKTEKPWMVMSAYNRLNGAYCSENKYLLTDILRQEWKYRGMIVSDWGAVDDIVGGIKAGLNLEMPSTFEVSKNKIIEAVEKGLLREEDLDQSIYYILNTVLKSSIEKDKLKIDKMKHHKLTRKLSRECVVLMKNEDQILPISRDKFEHIAIIGEMSKKPRYQGNGSSRVHPYKLKNFYDEFSQIVGKNKIINYAKGYDLDHDEIKVSVIDEAVIVAEKSDVVILFVGLPDSHESESFDRKTMDMPDNQLKLIERVSQANNRVIVVLSNGSVVNMKPWDDSVKGIVEGWLLGETGGGALADIILGVENPSGKLPVTIPKKLSDAPSYISYPGENGVANYSEGIFVGYRYYDKREVDVAYPFGHGLSYTKFDYSNLKVNSKEILASEELELSLTIKNTGQVYGKEVVQLYVRDQETTMNKPEKELKGFCKVNLNPGEEKIVHFRLNKRSFSHYDVASESWQVEPGIFEIQVGRSSRDICCKKEVLIKVKNKIRKRFTRYTSMENMMHNPNVEKKIDKLLHKMIGFQILLPGKLKSKYVKGIKKIIKEYPIHKLIVVSKGAFTEEMLQEFLDEVNNEF